MREMQEIDTLLHWAKEKTGGFPATKSIYDLEIASPVAVETGEFSAKEILEQYFFGARFFSFLPTAESLEEAITAFFVLKQLKEEGTGLDCSFLLSLCADLEDLQGESLQTFFHTLQNPSLSPLGKMLLEDDVFSAMVTDFSVEEFCSFVVLRPKKNSSAEEIEKIVCQLMTEERKQCFVALNPMLLGYDFVRETLEEFGVEGFRLDEEESGLDYVDLIPMCKKLNRLAQEEQRGFAVMITPELPTLEGEVPWTSTYPLAISLAAELSGELNGMVKMGFHLGENVEKAEGFVKAGICPVVLSPLSALIPSEKMALPEGEIFVDPQRLAELSEEAFEAFCD